MTEKNIPILDNIKDILFNIGLLKRSEESQRRANVRMLWKLYKKLDRKLKKKGYTDREREILDNVLEQINNAADKLNE